MIVCFYKWVQIWDACQTKQHGEDIVVISECLCWLRCDLHMCFRPNIYCLAKTAPIRKLHIHFEVLNVFQPFGPRETGDLVHCGFEMVFLWDKQVTRVYQAGSHHTVCPGLTVTQCILGILRSWHLSISSWFRLPVVAGEIFPPHSSKRKEVDRRRVKLRS